MSDQLFDSFRQKTAAAVRETTVQVVDDGKCPSAVRPTATIAQGLGLLHGVQGRCVAHCKKKRLLR